MQHLLGYLEEFDGYTYLIALYWTCILVILMKSYWQV